MRSWCLCGVVVGSDTGSMSISSSSPDALGLLDWGGDGSKTEFVADSPVCVDVALEAMFVMVEVSIGGGEEGSVFGDAGSGGLEDVDVAMLTAGRQWRCCCRSFL